ncbi:MAG: hypothetical protein Tp1123DCM257201_39 [Prokaryotic dsDNA virus sp.]|nr:MAG: hypothetical protein Tp1123DCM257201_39 [Prokaryotic dsDNA virus sp.]|tara:strand:+ start:4327 stop:5019 length:693 start_codon:yes stop_codon:yes gene_type:complete
MSDITNKPIFANNDVCQDDDGYKTTGVVRWPPRERRADLQARYGKYMPESTVIYTETPGRNGQKPRRDSAYIPTARIPEICAALMEAYEAAPLVEQEVIEEEEELEVIDLQLDDDELSSLLGGTTSAPVDYLMVAKQGESGTYAVDDKPGYSFAGFDFKGAGTVAEKEALVKFTKLLAFANSDHKQAAQAAEAAEQTAVKGKLHGKFIGPNAKRPKYIPVVDIEDRVTSA